MRAALLIVMGVLLSVTVSARAQCELDKVTGSEGAPYDLFGAAVSIDGDRVVVGAFWADVDGVRDAGAAYVFRRERDKWREEARLSASHKAVDDRFGRAVALVGDRLVVGADKVDLDGLTNAGAAYVFRREGNRWVQAHKLTSPSPQTNDGFGFSVSIHGDRLVIGAAGDVRKTCPPPSPCEPSMVNMSATHSADGADDR